MFAPTVRPPFFLILFWGCPARRQARHSHRPEPSRMPPLETTCRRAGRYVRGYRSAARHRRHQSKGRGPREVRFTAETKRIVSSPFRSKTTPPALLLWRTSGPKPSGHRRYPSTYISVIQTIKRSNLRSGGPGPPIAHPLHGAGDPFSDGHDGPLAHNSPFILFIPPTSAQSVFHSQIGL